MKKDTINRILICTIAFLVVVICILLALIASRPKYINTNEVEKSNSVQEIPAIESNTLADWEISSQTGDIPADTPQVIYGKTSTKVNLRERDNADSRVLKTVEAGYEFEIIEVQNNGWTKIKDGDTEAYISSLYVIILKE